MPQQVQVDGVGLVEFSDDFTPDEIASQVDNIFAKQEMEKVQGEDKISRWIARTESIVPPLLLPPEAPGSIERIAGESTAGRVVSGATRGAEQIVRGLGAPENIPLAPLALIPGVAPAMGLYFGGQALGTGAGTLSAASTPEDVGQGIAETAIGGLMAAHPLVKSAKPIIQDVRAAINAEWIPEVPQISAGVDAFIRPAKRIQAPGEKRQSITVPESIAEPMSQISVLGEIRAANAQTIAQIQQLFPKSQLTREQARELRNAAWGKPTEGGPNAIPIRSPETLPLRPPPGDRGTVVEGVPAPGAPTGEGPVGVVAEVRPPGVAPGGGVEAPPGVAVAPVAFTRRGLSEADAIEMAAKDTAKGTPSEAVPDPKGGGKWAVRRTPPPEAPPPAPVPAPVKPAPVAPAASAKRLPPPPEGAFEEVQGMETMPGTTPIRWFQIKSGEYKSTDGGTYRPGSGVSDAQMRMLGFEPPPVPKEGTVLRTSNEVFDEVTGKPTAPVAPAPEPAAPTPAAAVEPAQAKQSIAEAPGRVKETKSELTQIESETLGRFTDIGLEADRTIPARNENTGKWDYAKTEQQKLWRWKEFIGRGIPAEARRVFDHLWAADFSDVNGKPLPKQIKKLADFLGVRVRNIKEDLWEQSQKPSPAAAPVEAKGKLVLWGRKAGKPWVKLTDNVSNAEMLRRKKDGWEVVRYPKGESPKIVGESPVAVEPAAALVEVVRPVTEPLTKQEANALGGPKGTYVEGEIPLPVTVRKLQDMGLRPKPVEPTVTPQAGEPPQEVGPGAAAPEVGPGRVSEPVPLEVKPTPVEPAAGLSIGPGARSAKEVFEIKQRKFHGRFKDTEEIQLETRKSVRNEFYSPRSHAEVNRAVNTMLEYDGIETMIRRLLEDDPTLPPDHKVAAQLNIMKRLNQQAIDLDAAGETAKANYVRDRQVELIDTLADRNATEMGRAISAYQMWNALTPEGILRDYKHKVGLIRDKALASIDQGLRGVVETVRSDAFKNAEVPAQRQMLLDAFKGLGRASKSVVGKVKVLMEAAKNPKVFDEVLMREVTEALKLPKLDEAFSRDLLKRAQEAMRKPEGFQRDFALSKLAGEIRNKLGISVREVATSWWYASILSGPPTQFVNAAAGMVRVVSDLGILGASHPRALAQMLKGYVEGTAKGWREAVAIVREGDYSRRESNLFEPTVLETLSDSPSSLKRALSYGKYVGRTMTAADMVNFKGASESFSRLKAWEQARKEGLKGTALQGRVDEILNTSWENVTRAKDQARAEGVTGNNFQRRVDEIIEQQREAALNEDARQFGLEATYNQEPTGGIGEVVKALASMKRSKGPLGVVSTFIVPFTRIVGNVFSEFLNWTPYGYVRLFRMAEKGSKSTDAFRMQAMKATLGTAALPALYATIKATEDKEGNAWFDINGPGPRNADLRKSMMQTGWRENSVKIGDTNIRFMNMPFAMPFALIGYLRDAEKYEKMDQKDVLDRFAFTMFYAGRSVFDVSFLTGLGDFFEGISSPQGTKKIANMMQRTGTGFVVPNLAKWLDRVWDPTVTKGDTLKERFIRDFPIARSSLGKPMLNLLGEPVVHEGSSRFSWDRFWTIHKPDPIWDLFAEKHVSPHMPSKSILIYGKPITPDQYYRLVQERGKILKGFITERLPELKNLDSERLQDLLGEMSQGATAGAKRIIAEK